MKKFKYISVIAIISIFIDQITKMIISKSINLNSSIQVIPDFFSITHTRNYGAAWSIMWNKQIFLILISIIALLFVIYLIYKEKSITKYNITYFGLLIGGIIGNLIDRISYGFVIDFLEFNIFGYHFPIFNIGDCLIVISIIMLILETFLGVGGKKNE